MASTISLKGDFGQFLWTKGKYEYVDSWPLMSHPAVPLSIVLGYLIFVLKLGPQFMENRPAYKLTWILALYNGIQVLFSMYMTAIYGAHIWRNGIMHSTCLMHDNNMSLVINGFAWTYTMAKISELLDTVFFVLRKKNNQVTFLHVYHHSLMMVGTWIFTKYGINENLVFLGMLNSAVHTVMYTYYGLAAFGPKFEGYLFWKKYITRMQMIQFLAILAQIWASTTVTTCGLSDPVWWFIVINLFLFVIMFLNFYLQTYKGKTKQ